MQVRRLHGDAGERRGGAEAQAAAHALPAHVPAPRHAAAAPRARQARVSDPTRSDSLSVIP